MDLEFELGDAEAPAGHALIYFTSSAGSQVFATYVLVLPIPVNLEKWVPPAIASMVSSVPTEGETATPMPPVAEEVESLEWLRSLAMARRDDLVNAGDLYSVDLPNLIQMTQQLAIEYGRLYHQQAPVEAPVARSKIDRYGDLTDAEKLNELTQLVGRLRDTLGTPESESVQADLRELAGVLPSKYRIEELLEWAREPGGRGQELATLHLQRSYKILNEEYLDVADIERRIKELQ